MGLFDYINAINYNKRNLFNKDEFPEFGGKDYVPFLINRNFSYFNDTIFFANAANQILGNIDPKYHFDFYRLIVDKKKRFQKWEKKETNSKIQLLIDYYHISHSKACDIIDLFSEKDFEEIEKYLNRGGTKSA